MSHTLDCNEGMIYGDACSCAPPAETPAPTIIGRTIISKPGAALTVTELHLNEETKRALSTNGVRIPPVARDAALHDFDVIDGLRADLAAAMKRADEAEAARICCEAARHAANEEIARLKSVAESAHVWAYETQAKFGRAVAFLMKRNYSSPTNNHESFDWYRERDAILADAESKDAGEAWTAAINLFALVRAKRAYTDDADRACNAIEVALAAVDARRAELAEARGLLRQCAALGHTQNVGGFCAECNPHKTPMERLDAAQERASAERAAHERTKAELADSRVATLMRASERDVAQADAAAMRDAWVKVDDYCGHDQSCETVDRDEQVRQGCDCGYRQAHIAMMVACQGTASHAIAARQPLLEAVVTAARNYREMYGPSPSSHDTGPEELDTAIYALDRAK